MSDETRIGDWLQVHSGHALWPLDPRPEEIRIGDVAQGLSHLCRFGGQCRVFYSVAQHSVFVAEICAELARDLDPEAQRLNTLAGLLHDAPEAFIADVPRPVKNHLPPFHEIEARLWDVCARKWGLADPESGEPLYDVDLVRCGDDTALITEKRDLMAVEMRWGLEDHLTPLARRVEPVPPEEARAMFLAEFERLHRL
ncbi:HD domain-containing protein [Candidatus Sumerlaeota bacterium]|nr:HD domain-containing protein [Candidatus Sumerlaeota bacterium]